MRVALVLLFSLGLSAAKPFHNSLLNSEEVQDELKYGTAGRIGDLESLLRFGGERHTSIIPYLKSIFNYRPGQGIGRYGDVKVVVDPTTGKVFRHTDVENKYTTDRLVDSLVRGYPTKHTTERLVDSLVRGYPTKHTTERLVDSLVRGYPTSRYPFAGKYLDVEDSDVLGNTIYNPFMKSMKHFGVEDKYITDLIEEVLIKKYLSEKLVGVEGKYITNKYDDLLVKKFLSEKYGHQGRYPTEKFLNVLIKKFLSEKYGRHFDVEQTTNTDNVYDVLINKFLSEKYGKHFNVGHKYTTDMVYDVLIKKYLSEKYGKNFDLEDSFLNKYETQYPVGKTFFNPYTKYMRSFDMEDKYTTGQIYDVLIKKYLSEKYGKNIDVEDYRTNSDVFNPMTKYFKHLTTEDKYTTGKIYDVLIKKYLSEKYGKNFDVEDYRTNTDVFNPMAKYFKHLTTEDKYTTGKIYDVLVKKYLSEKYGKNFDIEDYRTNTDVFNPMTNVFGTRSPIYNRINKYIGGRVPAGKMMNEYLLKKYLNQNYGQIMNVDDMTRNYNRYPTEQDFDLEQFINRLGLKYDVESETPYLVNESNEEIDEPIFVQQPESDDETNVQVKYDVESGKPYVVKSKGNVGVKYDVEFGKPYLVKDVSEKVEGLDDVQDAKYMEINSIPEGKYSSEDLKAVKYGKKHMMKNFVPEV